MPRTSVRFLTVTSAGLVQATLTLVKMSVYPDASRPLAGLFDDPLLQRAEAIVQRGRLTCTLALIAGDVPIVGRHVRVPTRLRAGRVVRARHHYRRRHDRRILHAHQAEAGVPAPIEGLRAPLTVAGRADRSVPVVRWRRIVHGVHRTLAQLAELEGGRLVSGRVQHLAVGGLGTARTSASVITGASGAPGAPLLLVLAVAGVPELIEIEVRVGRLRIALGRKFEDQRGAGRLD